MAGSSPGTSKMPPSLSGEMSGAGGACPSPCNRGCAPRECTVKLPTSLIIGVFIDEVEKRDYLKVSSLSGESIEARELSLDNFVRTISKSAEVEAVRIHLRGPTETSKTLLKCMKAIPSLKSLSLPNIYSSRLSVSDAEAIFSVLGANSTFQRFDVSFACREPTEAVIVKVLVDALLQTQVLQQFSLGICGHGRLDRTSEAVVHDAGGMREVGRYLKAPTNVLTELSVQDIIDDELVQLADMLRYNKLLKFLQLFAHSYEGDSSHLHGEGMSKMGEALRTNPVLGELFIHVTMGGEEMKALVGALIPDATSGLQPNTHLHTLSFVEQSIQGKEGMEQLATLLRSNTSLLALNLLFLEVLEKENGNAIENAEMLFTSLRSNASLESLDLSYSSGIGGKQVLGMIMDMLLHNHSLRKIDLEGTHLEKDGDAEVVYAELRTRDQIVDRKLEKAIQSMEHVPPNSARVFLCGDPEAGKTTLCQRWKDIDDRQSIGSTTRRKKKMFPISLCGFLDKSKQPLAGKKPLQLPDVRERTCGIEVHKLVWKGMKISLWDMAGQSEYHAFHDLVLPNQCAKGECCFYFIVCNPMKHWSDVRKSLSPDLEVEIGYWLMFLASNTRRSESYRPHVTILMTHHDLWKCDKLPLNGYLEEVVMELKEKFRGVLDFDEDCLFIKMDNRSQTCDNVETGAEMVQRRIELYLEQLTSKLPKILKASMDVQMKIEEWHKGHSNEYIVKWESFSKDLCGSMEGLNLWKNGDEELLEKVKKRIASSLHSGGHIMYFEDIGMVIMNPHWFCNKVMGNILLNCTALVGSSHRVSNGIIFRAKLMKLVQEEVNDLVVIGNHFDDILKIMSKLQICYEDGGDRIMIPSILNDKSYSINWSEAFSTRGGPFNYVGTSLTTQDNSITLPTAGFFPRLQVYLHSKYVSNTYKVYLNVISFICDDINVFIICKDGSINILSRSIGDGDHANHALLKMIINHINNLRQKPTLGCPGVIFEEHIIRPECVEHPSNGRLQSVSKKQLKKMVLWTGNVKYSHHWAANGEGGNLDGCHFASELLGDEEWQHILRSRDQMVKELNKELDQRLGSSEDIQRRNSHASPEAVSPNGGLIPSDPQQVFMERKFDSMKRLIQGNHKEVMEKLNEMEAKIICSQEELVARVCSNIDHLLECSLQLKNSKIPKLPCIMRFDGTSGKCILLKMVPGLTTCHLQFRCEHNDHGFHLVDGQPGCEIHIGNERTRKFEIVMFWGLTISTMLLKVGAHLVAGMGSMVPNLPREFATILDTPGLLDLAQPRGGILECLPAENKDSGFISVEDSEEAKVWLVNLLESKCKSKTMYDMFKLSKVAYTSRSSKKKEIGWVCDAHKN